MMDSQMFTSEVETEMSAERKRSHQSVFQDYKEIIETAVENEWMLKPNKSVEYGKIEQSQLQHMHNGVSVLFTLYQHLPSDHFFVDEKVLREAVALYCCHDYHKMRESSWDDEFEITVEEAELFIERMGIETLWGDVDSRAVRGVMASHHMSDAKAKKNEVPMEYLDSLYLVMLADTLASKPTLSSIGSNAQSSVSNALSEEDRQYTVMKHSLKRSLGDSSMILNKAVADTLLSYNCIPIRVYEDGCVYVTAEREKPFADSELNTEIFQTFRDYIGSAHPSYTLDAVESSNIELVDTKTKYYEVGFDDVLFRGIEDTIRGVVKQSVADSRNMTEATETMKRCIQDIQQIIDFDFHTGTRRVEGLASGVHTIYRQFTESLVDSSATDEDEPVWKTDRVMATLKIFGLYEDEQAREQISILQEWGDGNLEAGPYWNYKYPIAQLIFDKYCTGESQHELNDKLTDVVLENLADFTDSESLEKMFIEDITSELSSFIGINVEIDGENLSKFRSTTDDVSAYTHNPEKKDCAVCTWGTTASEYDNRLLADEETVPIEINVTGTGEHETVSTTANEPFCFMCQLEFSLREEMTKEWGDDDVVYATFEPEYSYTPFSWWTLNTFLSSLRDYNTDALQIDSIASDVLTGEIPEPMEQVLSWDATTQIEDLTSIDTGFSPQVPYGGRRIPVANLSDTESVFEAVSAVVAASVYSGVRVTLSTTPMSRVDYNTKEMISFEPVVSDQIPFEIEDYTISLAECEEYLRTVCVMEECKTYIQSGNDAFTFDSTGDLFTHFEKSTKYPGSRIARIAREKGMNVSEYGSVIRTIDGMFGGNPHGGLIDEVTMYAAELNPSASAQENKQFVENTLRPIATGKISKQNIGMWAQNKAEEQSLETSAFSNRLSERYSDCIVELCEVFEADSERFISLQSEVGDVIEMRTYERQSDSKVGDT